MGGSIWVESTPGEGATFHFTADLGIVEEQPASKHFERSSLAGMPVLVVDDNSTNRRILEEMLKSWHLQPSVVDGGVAALTELQKAANQGRPYRLILLDCMMPGMDGFECLEKINQRADAMCISQTPAEALKREWAEHCIDNFVKMIAGQEMGTKSEHIKNAAAGKYPSDKILMIGDAPGDYKAAKSNNALFYPITPGHEEMSWRRLYEEGLERFFSGSYAGAYEAELVKEFDASLPEKPNW
jgi:CheY-like chemotaxis protein